MSTDHKEQSNSGSPKAQTGSTEAQTGSTEAQAGSPEAQAGSTNAKNEPADAEAEELDPESITVPCCSEEVHIAFRSKADDRLYMARDRKWQEVRYYRQEGLRVFCAKCRHRVY